MRDVFYENQKRVAKKTVNLPPELDGMLGGMTIHEAEDFLRKDKEARVKADKKGVNK